MKSYQSNQLNTEEHCKKQNLIIMGIDKTINWTIPEDLTRASGRNVLIFGGTGGLGRAIAAELAKAGANITVVGRTFRDSDIKNISFIEADLTSIKGCDAVVDKIDAENIDVVLFTTGIFAAPSREETDEGLEKDMCVSFLNRLVLLDKLAPMLQSSNTADTNTTTPRVFVLAYPGDNQLGTPDDLNTEKQYGVWRAHMNTVAGNEALVYDAAEKYGGINFYGLKPGLVKTGIRNNVLGENSWKSKILETALGWFTRTPEQYAKGIAPLFFAKELDDRNGTIYDNYGRPLVPSVGLTPEYAHNYIEKSWNLLASKGLA